MKHEIADQILVTPRCVMPRYEIRSLIQAEVVQLIVPVNFKIKCMLIEKSEVMRRWLFGKRCALLVCLRNLAIECGALAFRRFNNLWFCQGDCCASLRGGVKYTGGIQNYGQSGKRRQQTPSREHVKTPSSHPEFSLLTRNSGGAVIGSNHHKPEQSCA